MMMTTMYDVVCDFVDPKSALNNSGVIFRYSLADSALDPESDASTVVNPRPNPPVL